LGTSQGGMNSTLWIRGVSDGELVLLNGIPLQAPSSKAYDLNTIPASLIERIEILRGAASTLYGADAMAGVINIITKTPGDKTTTEMAALWGGSGFEDYSVSVSAPKVQWGASRQCLGPQEEISRHATAKYRFDTSATSNNTVSLSFLPQKWLRVNYLGSYNHTGFRKIYDAAKPVEEVDQTQTKHFGDLRASLGAIKAKLFASHDILRRDEVWKPSKPATDNRNHLLGGDLDHTVSVGATTVKSGASFTYLGSDYKSGYGRHYRRDYGTFLELTQGIGGRLSLRLGGRLSAIDGEPGTSTHRRFLPSGGALFAINEGLNLYADSGQAFRMPTFNNLYLEGTVAVGNPSLSPERGWTHEIGLKWSGPIGRYRLAGFYMDYKDKIETDRRPTPRTYYNAGAYLSRGFEIETTQVLFPSWSPRVGRWEIHGTGTFANPVATDPNGVETQAAPKVVTGGGLSFSRGALSADVNGQWTASRERDLDAYSVMNLSAGYRVWKGAIKFEVDNLFDRRYQTMGEMTPSASSRYAYYDLGRLVKAGYDLRF